MSGHSKWSTIKRKKGAEDAKRGKVFTKLAKDITLAAREGGGDETSNAKLKLAIGKAKSANMPKDNIDRAIKRGTGEIDGGQLEELIYEGYGPDGIAFIVEIVTDNKNRSLAEVKHAFNKNGGNLANSGAVAWQFEQKGYIVLEEGKYDFEEVFMIAAEAGADDVADEEGLVAIYTPREAFGAVIQALQDNHYEIAESELRWEAQNTTELSIEQSLKNMRLMDWLDNLDDVQNVSCNLLITDEIAEAFGE
ncbi:YebC/PmpR family DNA-binding transcriptional regulator [Anaerolineales bacterium]